MGKNIIDFINNNYLPKRISYQIVINLLILKTLSKKQFYQNLHFTELWDNLTNKRTIVEQKEYFIYNYLPYLQNREYFRNDLFLIFKNIHVPFLNIDDHTFSKFIYLVNNLNDEDISEFIANISNDFSSGYNKTLGINIQKNIIKLLNIKNNDTVLDLNVESSNFLSHLENNSFNNKGFVESNNGLQIRFLEYILNDNFDTELILGNPLFEYQNFKSEFDIVFGISSLERKLFRSESIRDFPINASLSHNLYIQKALDLLNDHGRCALIVPDSFLTQTNYETENIRQYILNKLVSIINLGAVFKPFIGIKVSLIIFEKKDNNNNNILMANFENDKVFPIKDFTDFSNQFNEFILYFNEINTHDMKNIIFVSKNEIEQNNCILDFKRYQPLEKIIKNVESPEVIIKDIEINMELLFRSNLNIKQIYNKNELSHFHLKSFILEEIASIKLGKYLPRDYIDEGDLPYVNISDINNCVGDYIYSSEIMISENLAHQKSLIIVKPNTILLSVRGKIGKVKLAGQKMAISPGLIGIEIDEYRINAYFIYQWFFNRREFFEANAIGSMQKFLSNSFIRRLRINLPHKEVQDSFERYKNDFNNLKQILSYLNEKYENLSKSIFNQFY